MAEQTVRKMKSLRWKLLSVLVLSMLIALTAFILYFYSSARKDAMNRFEQQTNASIDLFADSLDYYTNNCIDAVKSVYQNRDLLNLILLGSEGIQTSGKRAEIYSYLRSISASMPNASQIFLAAPKQDRSYLYIPAVLQTSANGSIQYLLREADALQSVYDLYIDSTHLQTRYGHIVSFSSDRSVRQMVYTIWVPISNVPFSTLSEAYVAVDIPEEFLVENCMLGDEEDVYILDENGTVLASNRKESLYRTRSELGYERRDEGAGAFISDKHVCIERDLNSGFYPWKIVRTATISSIYDTTWNRLRVLMAVFAAGLIAVFLFNIAYISYYTHPLEKLISIIRRLTESKEWETASDLRSQIRYAEDDEIGTLIQSFETMINSMQSFRMRQYELELLYADSSLKMLQAQINPHFIYNTIQCLATNALQHEDREQYRMLTSFGKMMHYSMILNPVLVPINSEVDYVERYVALQKMRFKKALNLETRIEPKVGQMMLPKMTIQPLVENSIIHGNLFRKENEDSWIRIEARADGEILSVRIQDNGVPISGQKADELTEEFRALRSRMLEETGRIPIEDEAVLSPGAQDKEGHRGIGIMNILARLMLFYGECGFEIAANTQGGTSVRITLPIQKLSNPKLPAGRGI